MSQSRVQQEEWVKVQANLREAVAWSNAYLYHQAAWSYPSRQAWANTWINQHDKAHVVQEATSAVLEQFLKEYEQKVWYKRLWAWLTQPISRLKQLRAHQQLVLLAAEPQER